MLGWKINKTGEYKIGLKRLSEEEEQLIEEIEAEYGRISKERRIGESEEAEELIGEILDQISEKNGVYLDGDQRDYLVETAVSHIYGFGPFDQLAQDEDVEEIAVIGTEKPVYVYLRGKGWKKTNVEFTDLESLVETANKMSKATGRRLTLQNPRMDAVLPDGSRIHASAPPVSGGEITVRKFSSSPFSPKELINNETFNLDFAVFFSLLMHSDSSVIIGGNTASGKTTTMNALFSFVPSDERIVIIEETPEINIPHKHQARLVSNKEMGISLSDLVYDSLRMRPDRTIVGEIRSRNEAEALFEILLSGQARGSYATMHAGSCRECFQRLKNMGVQEMDLGSVDAVVIQRRMLYYNRKNRRNEEIRRIIEVGTPEGEMIFNYEFKSGKINYCRKNKLIGKVGEKLGVSRKELEEEWGNRRRFIEKSGREYFSFYKGLQKNFYGLKDED
ncbi:CpaF family protein [Candidatus Micrarchaeota archaeon]|nr:CpaF family protein [Candidatus Micrarchaeota archaeon]